MTGHTTVLLTRNTRGAREATETHAERLRDRGVTEYVDVVSYDDEPGRELKQPLQEIDSDVVYAVPFTAGYTKDTREALPRALSHVDGTVRYCRPAGAGAAATAAAAARAREAAEVDADTSIALVGFGGAGGDHRRDAVESHAERLRETTPAGEVVTCYLIRDPSVECVRYNLSKPRAVAVPLFMSRCEATEEAIPRKLELERGGVEYADVLGGHPAVTDAIQESIQQERAAESQGREATSPSVETATPVATDGEGR